MNRSGAWQFFSQVSLHRQNLRLVALRGACFIEQAVSLAWIQFAERNIGIVKLMRRDGKEHARGAGAENNAENSGGLRRIEVERAGVGAGEQGYANVMGMVVNEVGRRGLIQMNHQRHRAIRIDTLERWRRHGACCPPYRLHVLRKRKSRLVDPKRHGEDATSRRRIAVEWCDGLRTWGDQFIGG